MVKKPLSFEVTREDRLLDSLSHRVMFMTDMKQTLGNSSNHLLLETSKERKSLAEVIDKSNLNVNLGLKALI